MSAVPLRFCGQVKCCESTKSMLVHNNPRLARAVNAAELRTALRRFNLDPELPHLAESSLSKPELIGRFLSN